MIPATEEKSVPAELKQGPYWVCWKLVKEEGKQRKKPYNPNTGKLANTTDPQTWATFNVALATCNSGHGYNGLGRVFSDDDECSGNPLETVKNKTNCDLNPGQDAANL